MVVVVVVCGGGMEEVGRRVVMVIELEWGRDGREGHCSIY